MKKVLPLLAATLLLSFGTANAQQMFRSGAGYAELGYSLIDVDTGAFSAKPGVLRGIVGSDVHPNASIEAMLGVGIREDDMTVLGVSRDVKVKYTFGLFAKPKVNIGERVQLFGRLGYARTKIDAQGAGSTTEGDFAYGLGANFTINPRMYAGLDWMQYFKKGGNKADGMTLSIGFRY